MRLKQRIAKLKRDTTPPEQHPVVLVAIEGNSDACPERPMVSNREAMIEDRYFRAEEGEKHRLVPQQIESDPPRGQRSRVRGSRPPRQRLAQRGSALQFGRLADHCELSLPACTRACFTGSPAENSRAEAS